MPKRKSQDHPLAHLTDATALITPYANTRAGFVQMALEKSYKATPMVAEARDLAEQLKFVKKAVALTHHDKVRGALLIAAGVSDKAAKHFDEDAKALAIEQFVSKFLLPAGEQFREEFVYRFLLTRGDSLGGAMRNVVGLLAQRRLSAALIARLRNASRPFWFRLGGTKRWIADDEQALAHHKLDEIKCLAWSDRAMNRVLVYNQKIPLTGNNIDLCLLNGSHEAFSSKSLELPSDFLALGELKGGIDPAGADEHWKTGNSALGRIRLGFSRRRCYPLLFFVGAAIEASMAKEIWRQLHAGELHYAANLTVDAQLASLCEWLTTL